MRERRSIHLRRGLAGTLTVTRRFVIGIIGVIGALSITACGNNPTASEPSSPLHRQPLKGSVLEALLRLESQPGFSDCERASYEEMKVIATELDAHRSEIDAYVADASAIQAEDYRKLGPVSLRRTPPSELEKPLVIGWQKREGSWWPGNVKFYRENTKTGPLTSAQWATLNKWVRDDLSDDIDRLVYNDNYSITPDDVQEIAPIEKIVRECIQTTDCRLPQLSHKQREWIYTQPQYLEKLAAIVKNTNRSIEDLQRFSDALAFDREKHSFTFNDTIHRQGKLLILPLDPGPFAPVKEEFAAIVESVWQSPELSLKIEWTQRTSDDPRLIYQLQTDVAGERASVYRVQRTIRIPEGTRERSLAHEVGHVLGFPDRYYTVWNPQDCGYDTYVRNDDLMSDSPRRLVTPQDWVTLQKVYR